MGTTKQWGHVRLVAAATIGALASLAWGLGCGEAFSSGDGIGGGATTTDTSSSSSSSAGAGGATSSTSSTMSGGAADAGEGGSPGECDDVVGDCADCARGACREPYCSCFENPDCWALLGCTQGCGTGEALDDCWRECRVAHPASLASHAEAASCLWSACSNVPCEGMREIGGRELCIVQQCASSVESCYLDQLCRATGDCIVTCADDGWDECMAACGELLPDGGADATSDLLVCILANCPGTVEQLDGGVLDASTGDAAPQ